MTTSNYIVRPPTGLPSIDKDPAATLDYSWDWSDWLDGDSISSATVTVTGGVTKSSSSYVGAVVTAWISGGAAGNTATATCTIATAGGRTDARTIALRLIQR